MRRATGTNHGTSVYDVPGSSDDENDDIPAAISPHRVVANPSGPSLPSLRPPRPLKRQLNDASLSHSAGSKRPRGSGVAPSPPRSRQQGQARKATGLASPTPSQKVPTPNNRASRSVSRESPAANDVDPELFALVNSKMLKRRPAAEDPLSPGAQLRLEEARQGHEEEEGEEEEEAEKKEGPQDEKAVPEGEEEQEEEAARERTEHGAPELDDEAIQNELRSDFVSIGNEDADEYTYTDIQPDGDIDLAVGPTSWTNGNTSEELDENESGENIPEQADGRCASQYEPEAGADDSELPDAYFTIARQADNAIITLGDQHSHGDPFEFIGSPDLANHDESAATSEIDSDVDFEVESDLGHEYGNLSLEECLVQDIDRFRSRTGGFEDSLLFEPPEAPSSTTIHLSSRNVEKLRWTIEKKSWVGRAKNAVGGLLDWETKLHDDWRCSESKTAVGKVLFHFVGKIDRLFLLVFGISTPETRNRVFSEHFDLLQYCFSLVENSISFIRDQRLSSTKQTPLNENKEKREEMVEEIARFHIPVIFQLLMRIWTPCSEDERRTSFDSFIVLLLTRIVGWIEQLYRPFIRDVRSAKGSKLRMKTREEFETPLKELRTQLEQAPELLEQEEELQAERKRRLRSQKEKRLQMENEEESWLEARRRQNVDVAILLKYEEGRKPEARQRQNRETSHFGRQEHPIHTRHTSEQKTVQSSPAASGAHEAIWHGEEERVLCEKLISSFLHENPKLPNLRQTAILIGHTREETVDKARELLQAIMSRGSNNMLSEEQMRNRVQSILRQWE